VRRPRLLDLFCGAGGAGAGYARAGFEVVGVDLADQPNYPLTFIQADALEVLRSGYADGFDAVHASPPCQAYSALRARHQDREYPDLVAVVRAELERSGRPWIIENVPGAPLRHMAVLCGSMFGLGATGSDGLRRQLRRHRLFEASFPIMTPPCMHRGQPVGVYGHGGGGQMGRGYKGSGPEYREAMGIDWATKREIALAIPPAYTEFLGGLLLERMAPPVAVG
jgi:DNA (cytosine-5)-methyltransferase 1